MLKKVENEFWTSQIFNKNISEDLSLLNNVQFIYELSLAELELKSFGANCKTTNELREFTLLNKSEKLEKTIRKNTAYLKTVDNKLTDYFHIIKKNQTRSVNQYLTHWIYPYKGKFHPQMIRALLNIIGLKKGDTVFEPFSGSGTTALEAQLLGINFLGIDISPLCVIQTKVKTESIYVFDNIIEIKDKVIENVIASAEQTETNYYKFIESLTDNEKVKNFYKLARLVSISDKSRRNRNFEASFIKNINLMIASVKDLIEIKEQLNLTLGNVRIESGDARNINLPDNSVDGIITSPPYSIALDYVKNDEHSLEDLGFNVSDMRNEFIGVRSTGKNKVDFYNQDMEKAYAEMYRILKPNKFAVIVIGNATYQSKEIKTVEFTIDYMENIGFKLFKNINKIIFGLYNIMKKENILIFGK